MAEPVSGSSHYDFVEQTTDAETPEVTSPRIIRAYLLDFSGTGSAPAIKLRLDTGDMLFLAKLLNSGFSASAPFDIPYITETGELVASELVADPGSEYVQVLKNLRLGTISTGVRALKWYTGTSGGDVDIEPGAPDDGNYYQINLCDYDRIIAKGVSVDLNSGTKQTLYTVPTGYGCIITKVVIRDASAAVTTAIGSFGFNAAADDVVSGFNVFDKLTGTTVYEIMPVKTRAAKGASTNTFGFKATTTEGSARTMVVDVFGYLL